MNAS
ncbi:hypothetical protein YPPY72_2896, partial [Yersinia pestis PY-72]|jgi:hypothetical protein